MRVRNIVVEDFVNYKKPCLFIASCFCNFKCCPDDNSICQNFELSNGRTYDISDERIFDMFKRNPITKAVVVGGLEPFLQFGELEHLIECFRKHNEKCPFVIYSGYDYREISHMVDSLANKYKNLIIKFGRFVPDQKPHYDDVLGVELHSNNQYAEVIS